jgi:hypothetical protein
VREDQFVSRIEKVLKRALPRRLIVRRGASLLYEVTVDNRLQIRIDPKRPSRGHAAFQTDLCVFERLADDLQVPRMVLEFKTRASTHDVLTYSAKARRHKQIYPYLRYGLIVGRKETIPKRFFVHNEALDFCVASRAFNRNEFPTAIKKIVNREISTSRELEGIAFGKVGAAVYRRSIETITATGKDRRRR